MRMTDNGRSSVMRPNLTHLLCSEYLLRRGHQDALKKSIRVLMERRKFKNSVYYTKLAKRKMFEV